MVQSVSSLLRTRVKADRKATTSEIWAVTSQESSVRVDVRDIHVQAG